MGAVISKAANGLGAVLGNAFVAPIKTIFGGSCEGVCSGTWDIVCFIEHLCVSNLVKLLMVFGLGYITLMFFYLLFQLGIIQCIVRSLCKMCWAACKTYWLALEDITCFLWYKLKNTKRVNRRRRRFADVEEGYSSSDNEDSVGDYGSLSVTRKRRSYRERRKDWMQRSLYPVRQSPKYRNKSHSHPHHHHHHHHERLKTSELTVHVKGGSGRVQKSRQLQIRKAGNFGREMGLFKRRKIR
ncbi:hypothetical protein HHK36_006540 [Tetracentron sinense]|uniref:Uncharacterized protein n=1 Tax=Tetracentron sinense TaxID=13715 RepID=A0A834ZHP2_TETSI|nr:hypothetical protein HHK36_006540 [Tetracentron sinense]